MIVVFVVGAFALGLALPGVGVAAAPPVGPRLTYFQAELVLKDKATAPEVVRLMSTDPKGGDARPLPTPPSVRVDPAKVSWDAEGDEFAFSGTPVGSHASRVYLSDAEGVTVHPVAGTSKAVEPVLSPDGKWLAFALIREHRPDFNVKNPKKLLESLGHSYASQAAFIVPSSGGRPRRLTPWGNGRFSTPSAFSPDGSTLAISVAKAGRKSVVIAVSLPSGKERTLEVEASEAAYSPDGSQIAFVSYRDHESVPGFDSPEAVSELYVAASDGSGARRITHTPTLEESDPAWDPSGARIAYLRSPGGMFGLLEGGLVESNADGSCPLALPPPAPRRKDGEMVLLDPSWWSGADRGAGPLSC
jgi:hypothetical protein